VPSCLVMVVFRGLVTLVGMKSDNITESNEKTVYVVWLHVCKFQELAKLTQHDRNQNTGCQGEGLTERGHEGTSWSVFYLALGWWFLEV